MPTYPAFGIWCGCGLLSSRSTGGGADEDDDSGDSNHNGYHPGFDDGRGRSSWGRGRSGSPARTTALRRLGGAVGPPSARVLPWSSAPWTAHRTQSKKSAGTTVGRLGSRLRL
jgi:hypothetical protein